MRNVVPALALAAALAAAGPAGAQVFKPKKSKIPDADVDRAVERGVEWLKTVKPTTYFAHRGATDNELIFYTLYHGGLDWNDPIFQKYLKEIVDKEPQKTYSVSVAAMCLRELDGVGYRWKLEQYAQFLLDNQCENGQWSYGEPVPTVKPHVIATTGAAEPKVVASGPAAPPGKAGADKNKAAEKPPLYGAEHPPAGAGKSTSTQGTRTLKKIPVRQRRKGPPTGDNSNSQYASLGLRACGEAGIELDEDCLKLALQWWEKEQVGDGGWSYGPQEGKSWGSMTAGGIGAVTIYKWLLGQPWKNSEAGVKGFAWLRNNWAVDKNPLFQNSPGRERWHYYYLYGLERMGMIYGTDTVHGHDWYDEGAAYLIKSQDPNGSWHGDPIDSCFAILFLRRATKPLLPKVYTGN